MSVVNKIARAITDHSPAILTALGIGGLVATASMAVNATPKAVDHLRTTYPHRYYGMDADLLEAVPAKEIVKLCWRFYIPAGLMGITSIAAIIGVNSIHNRRQAVLASVYTVAEATIKEYQAKIVETLGESGERKIRESIASDRVREAAPPTSEVLVVGIGEMLCYDTLTGRYFKSDIESLRRAQNTINATIIHDMAVSQNEFNALVGLPDTPYGDEVGWSLDHMVELDFSSMLADDGRPCLVVDHRHRPKPRFYKVY